MPTPDPEMLSDKPLAESIAEGSLFPFLQKTGETTFANQNAPLALLQEELGGGGGAPSHAEETVGFALDPAGDHPHGCVIRYPSEYEAEQTLTLPALEAQPEAGYTARLVVQATANTAVLRIAAASASLLVDIAIGTGGLLHAVLIYHGGNEWSVSAISDSNTTYTQEFTNADS